MTFTQSSKLIVVGSGLFLFAACGSEQTDESAESGGGELSVESADQKISYAIGYQAVERFSDDEVFELDRDVFIQGINDAFAGKEMAISEAEVQAADGELRQRVQAHQSQLAEEAKASGSAFLDENAEKADVVTTESGLQYEVIEEGESEETPEASDTVTVHYHGTLTDGTVFDSSVDRGEPATFPLNNVISGWTEGLQYMSVGDKYRFYIPSDLGYGARAQGPIPANSVLIFDVELLGINDGEGQ